MKTINMFAIYKGVTFNCGSSKGGKQIDLYSDTPISGFADVLGIGKYVKSVARQECDRVWKQELFFKYMDSVFRVWKRSENMLYLEADRDTFDADKYGFELVRRGDYGSKIYGKWVSEADGEEKWVITEY